jgi:hypothetical protein
MGKYIHYPPRYGEHPFHKFTSKQFHERSKSMCKNRAELINIKSKSKSIDKTYRTTNKAPNPLDSPDGLKIDMVIGVRFFKSGHQSSKYSKTIFILIIILILLSIWWLIQFENTNNLEELLKFIIKILL